MASPAASPSRVGAQLQELMSEASSVKEELAALKASLADVKRQRSLSPQKKRALRATQSPESRRPPPAEMEEVMFTTSRDTGELSRRPLPRRDDDAAAKEAPAVTAGSDAVATQEAPAPKAGKGSSVASKIVCLIVMLLLVGGGAYYFFEVIDGGDWD